MRTVMSETEYWADCPLSYRRMRRSVFLFAFAISNACSALTLDNTLWAETARRHALDPAMLYAVALSASARQQGESAVSPWPWTLESNDKRTRYRDRREAARALSARLKKSPNQDIRIGLLGVSLKRWGHRASDPAALLDPKVNLSVAAQALKDTLLAALGDRPLAIGRYRYGDDSRAARAYGARVLQMASRVGDTQRTKTSEQFCALYQVRFRKGKEALIGPLVAASARAHGIDPAFVLAVAKTESHFNQEALSPKGARGVMQLMPGTAARYGARAHSLTENIDAGVRYLRDLSVLFGGDPTLVAAGYNAGENAVIKYGNRVPPYSETRNYVRKVARARGRYRCR